MSDITYAETLDWWKVQWVPGNDPDAGYWPGLNGAKAWLEEFTPGRYLTLMIFADAFQCVHEVRFERREDAALFRLTFQ